MFIAYRAFSLLENLLDFISPKCYNFVHGNLGSKNGEEYR